MNLNIQEIKELENGGAELIIDMDEDTKKYLLNFAIMECLKRGLVDVTEMWKEHEDGRKNQNQE